MLHFQPLRNGSWLVCGAVVWALLTAVSGVSAQTAKQKKGDDFDPFAVTNSLIKKADANTKPKIASGANFRQENKTAIDDRIDFEVNTTPEKPRRGETARLTIRGLPKPGFHTYPIAQRGNADQAVSTISYKPSPGLLPLSPIDESPAHLDREQKDLIYTEPFTWSQDILILPDAKPGALPLTVTVELQVCDDRGCIPDEPRFAGTIQVSDAPSVPLTPELEKRSLAAAGSGGIGRPAGDGGAKPIAVSGLGSASAAPPPSEVKQVGGVWSLVPDGIFWGALSLLTPCVFPMIPITVSFFLKQSEHGQHRALASASIYSGTILAALTIAGLLLVRIVQPFSQHWGTNLFLGALFILFALSLFGMYEIRLPSGLANFTSARGGQGGVIGTVFMALTFTIISFTCIAPFYGGFIGLTASAQTVTDWFKIFLGVLAFSATFASPFFVLALFPSLLRSLPKSGSWMNTVKVVMGFLELAAGLKFLRAAELYLSDSAEILSYDVVLGVYVALAILCGLYLLKVFRLPHDDQGEAPLGVGRLLFSILFLSLGFYLLPGLFKTPTGQQRPSGVVFGWVNGFLLRESQSLPWLGSLEKGLQEAEKQRKLVFVDFTGKT
jgi:thiol:disulfide interchange protein